MGSLSSRRCCKASSEALQPPAKKATFDHDPWIATCSNDRW